MSPAHKLQCLILHLKTIETHHITNKTLSQKIYSFPGIDYYLAFSNNFYFHKNYFLLLRSKAHPI